MAKIFASRFYESDTSIFSSTNLYETSPDGESSKHKKCYICGHRKFRREKGKRTDGKGVQKLEPTKKTFPGSLIGRPMP